MRRPSLPLPLWGAVRGTLERKGKMRREIELKSRRAPTLAPDSNSSQCRGLLKKAKSCPVRQLHTKVMLAGFLGLLLAFVVVR
ncbi:hypothetical protein J4Q44_G00201420 [Coregonus suidteri]|uniref:Uncharacterized protein n=1 Tax=Coregonus suidteri TaxID=861788 RepID=A0AAN8LG33_9TELE